MKAVLLTLFLACIITFSCNKTAVIISQSDLSGSWKLARITGGIAGIDTIPSDNIIIAFQTNGNYNSTLNNTIESS